MGMKYCKRKIPRLKNSLLDNELWSVEGSSCTAKRLGQILKPEMYKQFYRCLLQELILPNSSNLDLSSKGYCSESIIFSTIPYSLFFIFQFI